MLGDVGQRLGRREVGRVLGLAWQPPGQGGVDRYGDRCLLGELGERRRQPQVGEDLRLDAVDQVPQVGHELFGLLGRGCHGLRGGRPGRQVQPGQAELTVAENIALPLRLDRRRIARGAIENAAARVGLSPAQLRRLPAEL